MDSEDHQLASQLLQLPTELRLAIWEFLLAPMSSLDDSTTALTTVSRMCSAQLGTIYPTAVAHVWNDKSCFCHARNFYLLDNKKDLSPQVLQINRQIYHEALPCLYRNRTFAADPNRTYESLHDRISDSWFILDRFLAKIGEHARSHVRSLKVPMLLSKFEVYGSHQAFYSLVSRLPTLTNVHLEVCPSSVRETNGLGGQVTNHLGEGARDPERLQYWLGPIMAFADASIKITAMDKNDLENFGAWKNPIEVSVWQQLLPLRIKRERRKIARIMRARGMLEYSDCADIGGLFEVAA
jgi:hypothetical protein